MMCVPILGIKNVTPETAQDKTSDLILPVTYPETQTTREPRHHRTHISMNTTEQTFSWLIPNV